MVDFHDIREEKSFNFKEIQKNPVAVALTDSKRSDDLPRVTAAGRGEIARQILQVAFDHDIKVREDGPLAQMLATVELDTPIPSEAFVAVAEVLSYVYRANRAPNPFNAILGDEHDYGP